MIRIVFLPIFMAVPVLAANYAAPAGTRPAISRPGAPSILPGGRIIAPAGKQYVTGPGPFGLAVSADHKTILTANSGPERSSLTVLERRKTGWAVHHILTPLAKPANANKAERGEEGGRWRSIFMGAAFNGKHGAFVSDGNSGLVRLVDLASGARRKIFDLNQDGFSDSYTGDLALDSERGVLYAVDQAN